MKADLFSNQAGPGVSDPYLVSYDEDNPHLARIISLVGHSASWNAADVTVEISHDYTASPSNWGTVQVINNGVSADLTFEANFTINLEIPPDVAFRIRSSDTGSPLTTLNVSAVGPITAAT